MYWQYLPGLAVAEAAGRGVRAACRTFPARCKWSVAVAVDVEDLFRRYGPMVLRRCRALLRDEELAVDAMQDTFVLVLRNRERLRQDAPSRLLYRMATNVCLNRIRGRRRHPEDRDEALLHAIAGFDDEGGFVARDLLSRLLSREQPSTRVIAVMHLLDGLTLEEVAEQVGLSVSGVRKRLRVLRERLALLEGGVQ